MELGWGEEERLETTDKTGKDHNSLQPLLLYLFGKRLMEDGSSSASSAASYEAGLSQSLDELSSDLCELKRSLLGKYWTSLRLECVEWGWARLRRELRREAEGEGRPELSHSVRALLLPFRLARSLAPDVLSEAAMVDGFRQSLETLAEDGWGEQRRWFCQNAVREMKEEAFELAHRISTPARLLNALASAQLNLQRMGLWAEGLSMTATLRLLPLAALLIARLHDLITLKHFQDGPFLQSIPPQLQLISGQLSDALETDLGIAKAPTDLASPSLPVHWGSLADLMGAGVAGPLRHVPIMPERSGRLESEAGLASPLEKSLEESLGSEGAWEQCWVGAGVDYLQSYLGSAGRSPAERRAQVPLLLPAANTASAAATKLLSTSPTSDDSGIASFAHSPNSAHSSD